MTYGFWYRYYKIKLAIGENWLELRYKLHLTSKKDRRHPNNKDQWESMEYQGR